MRMRGLWFTSSGLAVGLLLGGILIGRATAQGGYRRWEYNCVAGIDKPWRGEDLEKLNGLGARGWDLVLQMNQGNRDVYCFKRLMP